MKLRVLPSLVMSMVSLLAACGGGVTDTSNVSTPRDTTGATPPGGTVQRAAITVLVQIDSTDRRLADAAGVSLAGLSVRLTRTGGTEAPRVAVTDAAGTVRFGNLLEGLYTASAERRLTADELGRLPAADRDAALFAGGGNLVLAPPAAGTIPISMAAARRGALVLSEWYVYLENPIPYNWGGYVEIYNNRDTTAYLDGHVLAQTAWLHMHTDMIAPCSDPTYRPYRHDPARLWLETGVQYPGSGREFPIPPGEARVYAMDAANHRIASTLGTQEDLSRAHFEHVGTDADVDNPVA